MKRMLVGCLLIGATVVVALSSVSRGIAGGSFERVVGVGARGASAVIQLNQTGPRSDSNLGGAAVAVPTGGYVRVYPFIGGLPAIPGRFYPAAHVLCLYWQQPVSNCSRLNPAGRRLLAPLVSLPLRYQPPTVPVAVRYSGLLRYANGNIFAALELAVERPPLFRRSVPADSLALMVTWLGPSAGQRPHQLFLTPVGVYVSKRLFPLRRGPWCYLADNLNNASASLIEAVTRVCG
jgi:hypothetical protein